ncbi:MAG TPA: hypothetical protein G4N92_01520 [Anaerolineae bacterium]|nr:hypothetical protein [Anaerolineae bacterium]
MSKYYIVFIKPGDKLDIAGAQIEAVHAYNIKRCRPSGRLWHIKGDGVGYILTIEGKKIYHAGDNEFIPEMRNLGHIDLALLPIDGTFTMSIKEAAKAAIAIKPSVVIPMHNQKSDPNESKDELESMSNIKIIVLQPGESFGLK